MRFTIMALAFSVLAMTSSAIAGGYANGDEIKKTVSGNTVQGSMLDSGAYSEFYASDGTIRADGYNGKWSIKADTMCFQYGDDPESCWNVKIHENEITWIQDGKALGTGLVVNGNPNGY